MLGDAEKRKFDQFGSDFEQQGGWGGLVVAGKM